MTGTASTRDVPVRRGRYTHHGMTPAAWAGTVICFLAFLVGCIGVVLISYPLMIAGGIGLAVALVVTQVMRVLGLGAD